MSLTLLSSPERWTSAYRPIEFVFQSTLQDLTDPGDTTTVIDITQVDGETILRLTADFATASVQVGDLIRLQGMTNGLYTELYRVRRIIPSVGDITLAISAAYLGDDFGGTCTRLYDGLRVGVEVIFTIDPLKVVKFTVQPDENGLFGVNIAGAAAGAFETPFGEALIGGGPIYYPANRSIAMGYQVTAFERYTSWNDGVPTVVELRKPFQLDLFGYRVINSCHPYHKEIDGGGVAMDWQDGYGDYIFKQQTSGKKFLTWGSRTTQIVRPSENFYLAMLWDADGFTEGTDFVVSAYQQDGTFITSEAYELSSTPDFAGLINVGPAVVSSTLNSQTAYYLVALRNRNDSFISETFRLNYDQKCGEVQKRMHWQNKLGGVDQFTFVGRERELSSVEREEVSTSYIPRSSTLGFNRRTYRSSVQRSHVLSSDQLKPNVLGWLAEDMFESADVRMNINTKARPPHTWWTPVIILSNEAQGRGTDNVMQRMVFEYTLGVDNRSQYG